MRIMRGVGALVATLVAAAAMVLLVIGTPTASAALPDFGSEPVQDTSLTGGASIADVRVGANDGFDRFVVEFDGAIGPYFVSYVDEITQDGSGAPVPVEGAAFIQVSLNGVPNEPAAPQDTIDAGLPGLIQVVGAGAGFEATVQYGLGTAQAAGFRVFTLTEPARLVIDIAHPNATPTATNTADPSETSATPTPTTTAETSTAAAADDEPAANDWLVWAAVALGIAAIVAAVASYRLMRRPR